MAFTLDATVGGANSNAFATRQEMIDIADGNIKGELFTDLDDDVMDKYISTASLRLNSEKYAFIKVNNDQKLEFPRSGIFDFNYKSYSNTEIPYFLKTAMFELILFWLQSDDRIMEEMELHDAPMLEGYKVGPLDYKFRSNAKMDVLPETVKRELNKIGPGVWKSGQNVSRLAI